MPNTFNLKNIDLNSNSNSNFNFTQYNKKKDCANNVYITGRYIATDPISITPSIGKVILPATPATSTNIQFPFIIKYNSEGKALWANVIKVDSATTGRVFNISFFVNIDSNNNVYINGQYQSTSDVNLGNGVILRGFYNGVDRIIKTNGFIIKYNSQGMVLWAKTCNTNNFSQFAFSTIDSLNNIYLQLTYSSSIPVPMGNGIILPATTGDATSTFIKYNLEGNVQWYKLNIDISAITIDSCDNIYIINYQFTKYNIIKYNTQGNILWNKTIIPNIDTNQNISFSIALDSCNNILLNGGYTSQTPILLGNGFLLPATLPDIFNTYTIKYNQQGGILWIKLIKSDLNNNGSGIVLDSCNNIYITGNYQSIIAINLGNEVLLPKSTGADSNVYIIKYNSQGNVQWARTIKADEFSNTYFINSITLDSTNNLAITGYYKSTNNIKLGNGVQLPATSSNSVNNAFIAKYNLQGTVLQANDIQCLNIIPFAITS